MSWNLMLEWNIDDFYIQLTYLMENHSRAAITIIKEGEGSKIYLYLKVKTQGRLAMESFCGSTQ